MAANPKKGLGRGLDALLADNAADEEYTGGGVSVLRTMDIEPNPNQPRKDFDSEALEQLAQSVSAHGLLQPIVVRRKSNGYYEIIAGERRWRACKAAGLFEVPVIVKDISDFEAAQLSLVENLQRENLNPIEEAKGYKELMEKYSQTQEQAAKSVGKSRSAVANVLRLLELPDSVQKLCSERSLSYGHARSLLPLCKVLDGDQIERCALKIITEGLSVRETETMVKNMIREIENPKPVSQMSPSGRLYYKNLENKAGEAVGRKVSIKRKSDGSGSIALAYSDSDDLEELMKSVFGENIFDGIE